MKELETLSVGAQSIQCRSEPASVATNPSAWLGGVHPYWKLHRQNDVH